MAVESITAATYFDELQRLTWANPGVTRDTYGSGENRAHQWLQTWAERLDFPWEADAAGNLYISLIGTEPALPRLVMGSHLDSVPHGGNYDGAAGVIAGLLVLQQLRNKHHRRTITVMAARGEEVCWFPYPYIGSKAALGVLPLALLDTLKRLDTGIGLAEAMSAAGFAPDRLRQGERYLTPERVHAYLELHIEQGPILVAAECPIAIVTGIRGNIRYPQAQIRGSYAHAGAVPRQLRHDAVLAGVEFVTALEQYWLEQEAQGVDWVATVGQFSTNPQQHALTKVAGEVSFSLDIRSEDNDALLTTQRHLENLATHISKRRQVSINLGEWSNALPGRLDPQIRQQLKDHARDLGIPYREMASGAGHDCAVFANQGIPTGMIFIRNENGSHNPDEAMDLADFDLGLQLLTVAIATLAA